MRLWLLLEGRPRVSLAPVLIDARFWIAWPRARSQLRRPCAYCEVSQMPVPAEERDRILRLIEAGQVSAAEAARLLDALASPAEAAPAPRGRPPRQRLVHIRVTDLLQNRPRTSVTIPVEL